MEFTCTEGGTALSPELWVDPKCAESCGISSEELQKYMNPAPLEMTDGTAKNPSDPVLPLTMLPEPLRAQFLSLSDEEFSKQMDYTIPPNKVDDKAKMKLKTFSE